MINRLKDWHTTIPAIVILAGLVLTFIGHVDDGIKVMGVGGVWLGLASNSKSEG